MKLRILNLFSWFVPFQCNLWMDCIRGIKVYVLPLFCQLYFSRSAEILDDLIFQRWVIKLSARSEMIMPVLYAKGITQPTKLLHNSRNRDSDVVFEWWCFRWRCLQGKRFRDDWWRSTVINNANDPILERLIIQLDLLGRLMFISDMEWLDP